MRQLMKRQLKILVEIKGNNMAAFVGHSGVEKVQL